MKQWMIDLLRRLLTMLEPAPVVDTTAIPTIDPLDAMAVVLVKTADEMAKNVGGEYKRHWVYAQLLKAFPDRPKREAALAIELAVQARGD